jgi:hypothetical protein
MPSTKLFDLIVKVFSPNVPPSTLEKLRRLNPQKIYVEEIRSILDVPFGGARTFCDLAVRKGIFERWIEVRGPDGRAPAEAPTEDELPPVVRCSTGVDDEEIELMSTDLPKAVFYRLVGESVS